jgi:PAS domain S-box-containing protein
VDDAALRDSLQELYEQAPCGYLFTLPDGTLTRVNQTFLKLTGYDREDLQPPRRFQDLLTVAGKLFYENQYAPLLRLQGAVKEVAFDLVRRDGERVPVLVNAVQRSNANGQPVQVASTVFEATDRRRYEHELLQARTRAEQLAAIVTVSGDAILTVTTHGEVQTWNPGAERLFGRPDDGLRGCRLSELIPSLADAAEWERVAAELRAGRSIQVEGFGASAGGRQVDISIGLAPHLGPLGELASVSLIIRDISERRAVERLQQEFLAMANHEMRTPLAAIRLRAQLLRRRGVYDEHALDAMLKQTEQLGRLVDDLLATSEIEAGRLDLHLSDADLRVEAQAAVESLQLAGRRVKLDVPSEPVPVQADRQRLAQIFTNLLTNAAKYSPDGSEIGVAIARADGEARISVEDRGAGIPADALPRLFDRFYRASDTAGTVQGLGLGLYITRRIVEAHGGRIAVASEPGQGSTFTVTLPSHVPRPA